MNPPDATSYYGKLLPIDVSAHGHSIDSLIVWVHLFMFGLFIGWGVFFVYCLWQFRQRKNHKATYEPVKGKSSKYVEVAVVVIEVLLLFGLSMPIWAEFKTIPAVSNNTIEVRLMAQQFAWNFQYPGPDGIFGKSNANLIDEATNPMGLDPEDKASQDDIVTLNNLYVPTGRDVIVHIRSRDVIHSFDLTVLRVKQDAIPGMDIPVHFKAIQTGTFDIACAQLCGQGHYKMQGQIHIQEPEEFVTWAKSQSKEEQAFDNAPTAAEIKKEGSTTTPNEAAPPARAETVEPNPAAAAPPVSAPAPGGPVTYNDGFDNH